jgi:hypothetical protein
MYKIIKTIVVRRENPVITASSSDIVFENVFDDGGGLL